MATPSKSQDRAALAALHAWRQEGVRAPALAPGVLQRLQRERLVQPDEFGQHAITERGEERLQRMLRVSGRAGRPRRRCS